MKKVLIIEDDKGIAELERDYLEANGFEVQMAFTGLSGKKAALSSPVDWILCFPEKMVSRFAAKSEQKKISLS